MLLAFAKIFIDKHPVGANRNDIPLYMIFGYLSFFRLDELAFEDYRKLILSQEHTKMHYFLSFVWDPEELRTHVREAWMEEFDYKYIDDKIIGGIEKNLPNVADILRIVERKATGRVKGVGTGALSQSGKSTEMISESQSNYTTTQRHQSAIQGDGDDEPLGDIGKKMTVVQPFNLTKPRPKVIPKPEALQREVIANPVPKHIFKKNLPDIEKEKTERRKMNTDAIKK